ncbi:ABC transporter substrate-binding protein [Limnochorda pilosa]|uniref:ABC transporter substrate-binding protein n=1 Tax=Limnochorda pilosa TaxID=1555112 RepID=A0A0K2SIQ1_LIMPI|nr:ABC transporter substrate-binding protein [Limnochorda pilosa]
MALALVVLAACWMLAARAARAAGTVRVGLQASGTFAWVLHAIERDGLDRAHGVQVEVTTLASKQAAKIALQAGEVDLVVDDVIGVNLLRRQGVPVQAVYPYSLAEGSLVVPAESPIRSLADLKGKRIGVASLNDKSWLILRAAAVDRFGFDPQEEAEALAAAPPLMQELLDRGELDAAMPYWHFVARLTATGRYRAVVSVDELLRTLDLPPEMPILVLVAREALVETEPEAVSGFVAAMRDAWDRLAQDPTLWEEIVDQGLYRLPDRSLLPAVQEAWQTSVPSEWSEATVADLSRMVGRLVAVAGAEVVGVERVDPGVFTTSLGVAR